jgi:hypothetical protein
VAPILQPAAPEMNRAHDPRASEGFESPTGSRPVSRPASEESAALTVITELVNEPILTPLPPALPPSGVRVELAPAPAPAIHVTIGRIEVRAVEKAPAGPSRYEPRGPRTSLEDYLRQRRGGTHE